MRRHLFCLLVAQFALAVSASAQVVLTFDDALARAKASPSVTALDAEVEAARARLRLAGRFFVTNPDAEYLQGPRHAQSVRTTDRDMALEQSLTGIIERPGRVAIAQAELDERIAARDEAVQTVTADIALAVVGTVAADERVRVADADVEQTRELLSIVEKRLAAGDVTALDVNAGRAEAARARAEAAARRAEREKAMGTLKGLLGLAVGETVELRTRLADIPPPSREALLTAVDQRSEIRRLRAQVERAKGELQLARSKRLPEFSVRAERQEEESAVAYRAGVRFTLPVFDRGQDLRLTGTARLQGAERVLASAWLRIAAIIDGEVKAYEKRREAASDLERDALAALADNERLSRRAYEEGELDLAGFLAFRQQTVAVRREHIDRLVDAAQAAVDLLKPIPTTTASPGN
jgi:cobalt-zinc-cadmium efflux system outer membrane protein